MKENEKYFKPWRARVDFTSCFGHSTNLLTIRYITKLIYTKQRPNSICHTKLTTQIPDKQLCVKNLLHNTKHVNIIPFITYLICLVH